MTETKICAITGCSAGIEKATAIEMARLDYGIIMLARDSDKSRAALEEIKAASGSGDVKLFYVDLASMESVRRVAGRIANEYQWIDVLINNAGVFKRKREVSPDGIEMTLAVNYLAPFLLTNLLLPLMEGCLEGRIVNLTSELYKKGHADLEGGPSGGRFNGNKAYSDSKLLLVAFTQEMSRRLAGCNMTVNCVHPGVVGTDVFREYPKWSAKMLNRLISKPEDAAEYVVNLATASELNGVSGRYFSESKMELSTGKALSHELSEQLWAQSELMSGLGET